MKIEDVNTTNGWGFDGIVGKRTYFDNGFILFKGKRSYRHAKPTNADHLRFSFESRDIDVYDWANEKPDSINSLHIYKSDGMIPVAFIESKGDSISLYNTKYELHKVVEL
jgi:hypothetical protein